VLVTTITNLTYNEIQIGDSASYSRTVTEDTLVMFGAVCGDLNPVHFDEAFAQTTQFKQRIVHGMWSGSIISAALALTLPGPGSVYLGQHIKFTRPLFINDTLTIELTVKEKHEKLHRIVLNCVGKNQHGKVVLEGTAEVMAATEKLTLELATLPEIIIKR
jgi:acyl dehydratase